jgi:hypothetical protein
MTVDREALGRLVRETWVKWAAEQPFPKQSWLTGWDHLDTDQREVDMRIGEAVAAAERERLRLILVRDPVIMADPVAIARLLRPSRP